MYISNLRHFMAKYIIVSVGGELVEVNFCLTRLRKKLVSLRVYWSVMFGPRIYRKLQELCLWLSYHYCRIAL